MHFVLSASFNQSSHKPKCHELETFCVLLSVGKRILRWSVVNEFSYLTDGLYKTDENLQIQIRFKFLHRQPKGNRLGKEFSTRELQTASFLTESNGVEKIHFPVWPKLKLQIARYFYSYAIKIVINVIIFIKMVV